jgi:hypothetical protein
MSQLTFPFKRDRRMPVVPHCPFCGGVHVTHDAYMCCKAEHGGPSQSEEQRYRQAMGQLEQ